MDGRLKRVTRPHRARGLAPLEMVLALPILLLVMALMVNFGAVASSRVDGLVAARHEGWASRSGRDWRASPPATGPAGGTPDAGLQPEVVQVREQHPVIHGPMPMGNLVNPDVLDPTRGMHEGSSQIERPYPMLRSLGTYRVNSRLNLLDGKWQHFEMGISNGSARILPPVDLYTLATDVPWAYPFAYLQAAKAIVLDRALQQALRPLDKDEEYSYYKSRFGWPDRQPAFYRYFPDRLLCNRTIDHAAVQKEVEDLVDRIQGKPGKYRSVAKWVAEWFRDNLYGRAIWELQNLLATAPPGQVAAIQAEIADLEAKWKALDEFARSIP